MPLLLDTDAFCKLAVGRLLRDTANLLGTDLSECRRLPALIPMLRRGRLRTAYGQATCDGLIAQAEELPVVGEASSIWLDRLTPIAAIDPGEAQIFAVAAEHGLLLVSDDKRALRALREVAGFPDALTGHIAVLEAILIALCDDLGVDYLRHRLEPLVGLDTMIRICFSASNPDPREALLSYYRSLAAELGPLILWHPRPGGRP